jgi:arsenite-transporting ATPase
VRTLLFTGPGGAGTTTLAASAAVRAARTGRRTLLISGQDVPVPGLDEVRGLDVVRVDAQAALERLWGGVVEGLGPVLPQLPLPPSSSVVPMPGNAELALYVELCRAEADLVVVDAGPIEAAAVLVGLPAALRWWLGRLMPPGIRALGALRTAAVAAGAARRGPVDVALSAVPVLEGLLARDRLAEAGGTAVYLVALPAPAAAARLRAAAATLALHDLRPAEVLSRVLPLDGAGEWEARRRAEQEAAVSAFAAVAPVRRLAELPVAPADVTALTGLLEGFDPAPGAPAAALGPERREGSWLLTVPLPFTERGGVSLTRWEDDLVITVGGARRCFPLDPLLRRCEVTGGRLADPGDATARLVVGFRPDPQLWPADLLASDERTS